MRKLILALILLAPALGCQRSHDVLDHLEPGSQVTVTKQDGQLVTGRLTETRGDAIVVQPAGGAAATVARKEIATVTIARVPAKATGAAASPGSPATGTATTVPVPPGQPSPADRIAGSAVTPGGSALQPSAAPPAPAWREVVVPAGTELDVRLANTVASDTSRAEEPVHAALVESVVVHGAAALPAGSRVSGTVTNAKPSGKVKGVAELAIRFDSVRPKEDAESVYKMRTGIVTRHAPNTHKKDALTIAAPAAGGAILGGLFGGKKGALIGTTVGGGAGTAVVLSTRGKEVRLPEGTRLVIKLLDPLTVRVPA